MAEHFFDEEANRRCVPSDAYMTSMRNSRRLTSHGYDNSNQGKPKWKATFWILVCIYLILLAVGFILFLTGLGLILSNRYGLVVLIIGSLMLLSGIYAINILVGTYLGWRGYDYWTFQQTFGEGS